MLFKAKLRKIGNSVGVILPKDVITSYNVGDEIELNVITSSNVITEPANDVITPETVVIPDNPVPISIVGRCIYCGLPLDQPSPQCSRH